MNPLSGSRLQAVLWILAGCFAFSLVFASGKLAGGAIPALQIIWIRYLSGFATVSAIAGSRPGGLRPHLASTRRLLHALRALCGVGGGTCNVYAAMHMPLADAAALALLQGVFTVMLAVLVLREKVSLWQVFAALLCLGGALVIVRGNSPAADLARLLDAGAAPLVALLGAFLIACEVILIKMLARGESMLAMLLHVNGFAALLLAVPVILLWQSADPLTLLLLGLLGPLAIAGQMCNVRGFRLADAAWLAPFGYSSVAFSALIGWAAFGTLPTLATLLGTVLIVGGGLVLIRR